MSAGPTLILHPDGTLHQNAGQAFIQAQPQQPTVIMPGRQNQYYVFHPALSHTDANQGKPSILEMENNYLLKQMPSASLAHTRQPLAIAPNQTVFNQTAYSTFPSNTPIAGYMPSIDTGFQSNPNEMSCYPTVHGQAGENISLNRTLPSINPKTGTPYMAEQYGIMAQPSVYYQRQLNANQQRSNTLGSRRSNKRSFSAENDPYYAAGLQIGVPSIREYTIFRIL